VLWAIAVVCASLWAQGLIVALTAGTGEQAGVLDPAAWDNLAGAIRTHPFRAVPLLVGPSRAHRLESWAFTAFPLGLVAEGAVILSLYLRRTRS